MYLPVCVQLVELLDRMHSPDERLLVVLTCCARLTDAVEADDQNLFKDIEGAIDPLNLKRCVRVRASERASWCWCLRGSGRMLQYVRSVLFSRAVSAREHLERPLRSL